MRPIVSLLAVAALSFASIFLRPVAAQQFEMPGGAPHEWRREQTLQIAAVRFNSARAVRWQPIELTLDVRGTWKNPFDPEDIDVWTQWTGPNGQKRRVNAFWYQPFSRKLDGQNEVVAPNGQPTWKVRWTPEAAGNWVYSVHARDRNGSKNRAAQTIVVTAATTRPNTRPNSIGNGFIRRSTRNPRGFATENERSFVPVGENVCWPGSGGTFDYDNWTRKLGQNGANWMRVWMCSWWGALEWGRDAKGERRNGDYHGVGVYSLDNAWRIDTMLDAARARGIATMLCLGTYGEFTEGGFFGEGQWKANPYNVANGGPCAKPADFWTNAQARKLYQRRLRYIAARWGYDTSIFAWEFWNEAQAPAAWVGEMARFLKGTGEFAGRKADPFGHLVSTTYGDDAVWRLPEIDFSMTHHYGMGNIPDSAPIVAGDAQAHTKYFLPHLMAEFGIDWRKSDTEYDPEGRAVNFHNGLWAGLLSGGSGSGMLWWWDNYVDPKNVYNQFAPLRRFVDAVDWNREAWSDLKFEAPRSKATVETFSDLVMPASSGWGKAPQALFDVGPTGVSGDARLPQHLYSPSKPELRTAPTFRINFPKPSRFSIRVANVSDRNEIELVLDGKVASKVLLDANPPANAATKPEYESTEKSPQWGIYQAKWNRDYSIEVPAGAHTVEVRNIGGDWVELSSYALSDARSSRYPSVNLYGLRRGREAVLWLGNAAHNWQNVWQKKPIATLRSLSIPLQGLPAGSYRVDWWDTQGGRVLRRDVVRSNTQSKRLVLRAPDFSTDVAAHIVAR